MAPTSNSFVSQLVDRDSIPAQGAAAQDRLTPVIIAGIVVAGVLSSVAIACFGIYWYRKRQNQIPDDKQKASVFNIGGAKKGAESKDTLLNNAAPVATNREMFSRLNLGRPDVIMPEKATPRPDASDEENAEHDAEDVTLPRPVAPFMNSHSSPPVSPPATATQFNPPLSPSVPRDAFPTANSRRGSVSSVSTNSSASPVVSAGGGVPKKVRQIFDPVLPDELVVTVGEYVTVITTYDDGWCIVGRDGLGGVGELGTIPSWCFITPAPGLRAERPLRTSSLGQTVRHEAEGASSHSVVSWSHF